MEVPEVTELGITSKPIKIEKTGGAFCGDGIRAQQSNPRMGLGPRIDSLK